MNEIRIFQPDFNDPELSQAFEDFFIMNDLLPLFTWEDEVTQISYGYLDALSVVNMSDIPENDRNKSRYNTRFTSARKTGANRNVLKAYSDLLHLSTNNQMYESALTKTIDVPMNFKTFMAIIKRQLQYVYNEIENNDMGKMWNIVWYADHKNGVKIW